MPDPVADYARKRFVAWEQLKQECSSVLTDVRKENESLRQQLETIIRERDVLRSSLDTNTRENNTLRLSLDHKTRELGVMRTVREKLPDGSDIHMIVDGCNALIAKVEEVIFNNIIKH